MLYLQAGSDLADREDQLVIETVANRLLATLREDAEIDDVDVDVDVDVDEPTIGGERAGTMTSLPENSRAREEGVLKVDSTDVRAARLKMVTSRRLGKPVPAWVEKVAAADRKSR